MGAEDFGENVMRGWISLFAACLFVASPAFAFQIFTVGPAADCPYHSIQDAVDAAAATPGVDYVWISNDSASGSRYAYIGQHIHVNDADGVIIEGGFVSCSDPDLADSDYTTISAASNDGGPVFDIDSAGGDVYLGNLFITGASRGSNSYGGGIAFRGKVAGALLLRNATVSLNAASFGAGIDVEGYTAPAALVLEQNTLVLNNRAAQSGGGVRIAGDVRMFATDPQIWIGFNHADNGDGGGINVVGPARADIGSPGYNGIGVVSSNSAQLGGGVSLYAGPATANGANAVARFFSMDGSHPVQISGNSATSAGGAFNLIANSHDCGSVTCIDNADVCLFDARVDDNLAPTGAAIYGATTTAFGEHVYVNPKGNCGPEAPVSLGAQACVPGVACDEISNNINEDGGGNPTGGATVELQNNGGFFYAERLHMTGNQGGHVFASTTPSDEILTDVELSDTLIADNTLSGSLVSLDSGADTFVLDRSTVAGNTLGAGAVILVDGIKVSLTNSIIDQPGHITLDFNTGSSNNLTANYVLATEILELGTRTGVMQGEPTFADAAHGNYHLAYGSLGIDFAPAGTGSDLDRKPRTVDLNLVPDLFGPMDLGAYELQAAPACVASDTIFCNGFQGEN